MGYKQYRQKMQSIDPPCMPYLSLYLSELEYIEDGNLSLVEGGLVNFEKMRRLAQKIREIQCWQQMPHQLCIVESIREYILSAQPLDDDEAFKLSQSLEAHAAPLVTSAHDDGVLRQLNPHPQVGYTLAWKNRNVIRS